jgi:hypothetical protein
MGRSTAAARKPPGRRVGYVYYQLTGDPQALEEPCTPPTSIFGQRQLLLSQLGDGCGCGGDAVDREVTFERFVGISCLPVQRERRREYKVRENIAAFGPPKPFDCLIVLSLHEEGTTLHVI